VIIRTTNSDSTWGWSIVGALGEYSEKAAEKADHVIKTYEATNLKGLEEAEVPDV
jgi:hypothetical protein